MKGEDWVRDSAERLGMEPPDATEVEEILALAGVAAHASERIAAPVACWLAGCSGRPLAELREIADEIGG